MYVPVFPVVRYVPVRVPSTVYWGKPSLFVPYLLTVRSVMYPLEIDWPSAALHSFITPVSSEDVRPVPEELVAVGRGLDVDVERGLGVVEGWGFCVGE